MFRVDVKGLDAAQSYIAESSAKGRRAISRAYNDTATHVKSNVSKHAREGSTIKATAVKAQITVPYRATSSSLKTKVVVSGDRVPLAAFDYRARKDGVSVKIFRNELERRLYGGAFVATMKSGHKAVFWRFKRSQISGVGRQGWILPADLIRIIAWAKRTYPGWDSDSAVRLPVFEILSNYSVPTLFADDLVWKDAAKDADVYLQKRADYWVDYYLKQ